MVRVLIAEDLHMVRGALIALLDLEPDITVVSEVASGPEIVPAALKTRPDVAVLDIGLPGTDGLTAAGELQRHLPSCRVVILTGLTRPGHLRRALGAHVAGFLRKDAAPDVLGDAIRRVAAGQPVIDAELAIAAIHAPKSPLTARETSVLRLAAAGCEPTEIARRLFLAPGTVRNYLTAVTTKLRARNRLDAVRIAQDAGWL